MIKECMRCNSHEYTAVDGSEESTLYFCDACGQLWEIDNKGNVEVRPWEPKHQQFAKDRAEHWNRIEKRDEA